MRVRSPQLVVWMRAAGEPSRLRLLALCGQRDLSVTDLARALGQSEPRVSRHLRILGEAGLLERLRQGQWVHYRLTQSPTAASFVQGLFALVDQADSILARDRERALQSHSAQGTPARRAAGAGKGGNEQATETTKTFESRLGRALGGFVEGGERSLPSGRALVVGVEHLELLESAAVNSVECVAVAHSRRAAQSARAFAERRGFACRVLLAASTEGFTERDIARTGHSFDSVFLNHLAAPANEFAGMLSAGKRALAPSGRLWLFERYEALESTREKVVEHPLARLRRLLSDLGLFCERVSPVEADGEHVLAAVAVASSGASQGTASAG
jgi:DNA-binding transcriptional ArsR family regulator